MSFEPATTRFSAVKETTDTLDELIKKADSNAMRAAR